MRSEFAINWTTPSVRTFAADRDPVEAIKAAARGLVLRARESGREGPPFNPIHLAIMLEVHVEANSSVSDTRLIATSDGPKIEFNPQQSRERVRFSIAHEIAHLLFSDWSDRIRNRGLRGEPADNWQLELLCNLVESEFVLLVGSLPAVQRAEPIEQLVRKRRDYDVSAEALLIRMVQNSAQPIGIFVASPFSPEEGIRRYRIDCFVSSPTTRAIGLSGKLVPEDSVVRTCTAIGHTDKFLERWVVGSPTQIECVGLPPYLGCRYARVAGSVRFDEAYENRRPIRVVHGDVLRPLGEERKIICQLVNDEATRWGGGIARKMAKRYPEAEECFSKAVVGLSRKVRLGKVIFCSADKKTIIANLIAQEGYGQSQIPRIRYAALVECFKRVAGHASETAASIHMPKLGTGAAGGDWSTM